jgi:uncharacterized protein
MTATVVLLPGLTNSGPEHWQRRWQREHGFTVVEQDDWDAPRRQDWVARLDAVVAALPSPLVLAAHSLGCATVAWWARESSLVARVAGALLVAPPDVDAPNFPSVATGFRPMPLAPLPFASRVVVSDDDEWISLPRARQFAAAWGSALTLVAGAGHINTASGHGDWPAGLKLLSEFR